MTSGLQVSTRSCQSSPRTDIWRPTFTRTILYHLTRARRPISPLRPVRCGRGGQTRHAGRTCIWVKVQSESHPPHLDALRRHVHGVHSDIWRISRRVRTCRRSWRPCWGISRSNGETHGHGLAFDHRRDRRLSPVLLRPKYCDVAEIKGEIMWRWSVVKGVSIHTRTAILGQLALETPCRLTRSIRADPHIPWDASNSSQAALLTVFLRAWGEFIPPLVVCTMDVERVFHRQIRHSRDR